jgi:diacylglycerol kinase (ATP)
MIKGTVKRFFLATSYAISGVYLLFTTEWAFALEVIAFFFLLPAAFFISHSSMECALMITVLFIILIAEALNSGIEAAVDFHSLEKHPLAKKAKDVAAAAVLFSIINAIVVWLIILLR